MDAAEQQVRNAMEVARRVTDDMAKGQVAYWAALLAELERAGFRRAEAIEIIARNPTPFVQVVGGGGA